MFLDANRDTACEFQISEVTNNDNIVFIKYRIIKMLFMIL